MTSRRRYVKATGIVLGAVAFAGCADPDDEPAGGDPETDAESPTESDSTDPASETRKTPTAESNDPATPIHAGYDTTELRVTTPSGDLLGSVTAAVADTPELRYLGLSDTESLPEDRGMLFVYEEPDERTFVMREMDFGIDIVYADDEGIITRIHHAPAPASDEDGSEQQYSGYGQYVLEVAYEWTAERGVGKNDVLEFEL